jgi:hypothetical protein
VNCAFSSNAATVGGQDDGGGAVYVVGLKEVQIGNCAFSGNRGSNGGAFYSLGSQKVTVVDSTFSANQATGTGGNPGNGGNAGAIGIDGQARLVDVCRTRFVGNTSNAYGSGFFSVMYDFDLGGTSRTRFEDTTFDGNRVISDDQFAAGAYIQGGPFAMERVSFVRNEANGYTGLFLGPDATGTIRNGTFVANVARNGLGGGIAVNTGRSVSIVNTTIAHNTAGAFAAGISTDGGNQLKLTNVILANNTGGNAWVSWGINNPAAVDGGGNMQWPATRPNGGAETRATPGTVFANPLLASAVADNGGAVPTLALGVGSPASDSGVQTSEVPSVDARGFPRVFVPDRGSYELNASLLRAALWHSWFAVDTRETPYVGDFNGDGRADIITFTRANPLAVGDVYVSLSNGSGFGTNAKWHDWFAISADETVVIGDYDGDGDDDIATWLGASTRQVYVATSYGTGMSRENVWLNSIGRDRTDVILAGDADGDGREDLIDFARREGRVYVALSTGSGFRAPAVWHNWFGVSTYERPRLAELNGDGRIDIVTFATNSPTAQGDVYVALSTGSRFGDGQNSTKWHDWFAVDPTEDIGVGEIDRDGRDDFFTFLAPSRGGQQYTVLSLGTGMAPNVLAPDKVRVDALDRDRVFVGDATGDGKADVIVFAQGEGKVYVRPTP